MKTIFSRSRDLLVPFVAFAATALIHFLWTSPPPAPAVVESPWASLPTAQPSRISYYLESGGYWLAYTYGISFAFAAVALRRFVRNRTASDGRVALGGATLSSLLAFFGCYLTGCCGSPMLVVYLSLFGAGFLPFAKPFVAALTTLSIIGAWWWMIRREGRTEACCTSKSCSCG